MRIHRGIILILLLAGVASGLWIALPDGENPGAPSPPSAAAVHDYPSGSAIDWQPWGTPARARAQDHGKGLFVYFHGQWCSWCRQYQQETLEHPATVAAIEAQYVPVLVNLDRRRDLFTRLGGRPRPAAAGRLSPRPDLAGSGLVAVSRGDR